MKLARRLVLWLIVGVSLVLGVFAWIRYQREVALFQVDVRRDHRAVTLTIGRAYESVRKSAGEKAARNLVADLDRDRSDLRLSLQPVESAEVILSSSERADIRAGKTIHIAAAMLEQGNGWRLDPSGDERLLTMAPIAATGMVLELSESLVPARQYLKTTMLNVLLAYLLVAAVCAAIVYALGVSLVGRPMAQLVAKARRIGAGDLDEPLTLAQSDEVGELAREMNAMCEQLALARSNLEAESAARVATAEQLRHADRLTTVGRLAAGLAHELGTPLNVVSGRAKLISRGRATPEQATQYADIIAEQADRMARIIRQLLDYARRKEAKRASELLMPLVQRSVELLTPLAKKRGVAVAVTGTETIRALVDAAQLQQALTNLLVNAIHASPEGGKVTIAVTEGDTDGHATIRIQDRGTGMNKATAAQAFEPFFTTKSAGEGTGLGLSITREIIDEHGGRIALQSELGHGSTFTVYLPTREP
ncbi:MAG TPA: HAMP domain-containing sensor histidine kinase [Polyangiaceae bacterium]|nr:HAMP domain-containing sensor histidine kinase [Polyangiaceae bacterium]HMR74014.1 HAMP domain-containing sensor histidine kinase [Polyangiaceae bacterium]